MALCAMDADIRFRLLGPLEVRAEAGPVHISGGRQQTVLCALLLHSGEVVTVDYLIDVLWDHSPPDTARTQIQICVSRLRRSLVGTGATIRTRRPGYVLDLDPDSLDVTLYRRMVRDAFASLGRGEAQDAVVLMVPTAGGGATLHAYLVPAAEADRISDLEAILARCQAFSA